MSKQDKQNVCDNCGGRKVPHPYASVGNDRKICDNPPCVYERIKARSEAIARQQLRKG